MKKLIITFVAGLFLAALPVSAFADTFRQKAEYAKQQVASRPQEQLDSLNDRVFTDAFITAKIVGFDRGEIDQMKAEVRALREENAQLRAQLASRPAGTPTAATPDGLATRVVALEAEFVSLRSTLEKVVTMLTAILMKLQ